MIIFWCLLVGLFAITQEYHDVSNADVQSYINYTPLVNTPCTTQDMFSPLSNSTSDVGFEKMFISARLNSTLMFVFLMGVYTMIYMGTLYFYVSKNMQRIRLVVGAMSALYIAVLIDLIIQWYLTKWAFVNRGDTRDTIFLANLNDTPQTNFLMAFVQYIAYIIANGILLGKCYEMLEYSARRMVVPLFLYGIEIVLCFAGTIITGRLQFESKYDNAHQQQQFGNVSDAVNISIFLTTLASSIIISKQIFVETKELTGFKGAFLRCWRMLIDSSVFYTITMLGAVGFGFYSTHASDIHSKRLVAVGNSYLQAAVAIASGLGPTLMIGRIALVHPKPEEVAPTTTTNKPISGLRFNVPTNHTGTVHTGAQMRSDVASSVDSEGSESGDADVSEKK